MLPGQTEKVIEMKLHLKLHGTCELYCDKTPETANDRMQTAIGNQFAGTQKESGFQCSHKDRNAFRPELLVRFLPDGEGTLIWIDYKMPSLLLGFMLVWSVVIVVLAIVQGLLLLVMLPVFWTITVLGYSVGVETAKNTLMTLFEADEVIV